MSRSRQSASQNQLTFLQALNGVQASGPGRLAWDGRLRALITGAIRGSRFSREQIAERMTLASGDEVTRAMLDAWTAPSKNGHRFPLQLMPAFCDATESHEILKDALAMLGARIATAEDLAYAEIGRLHVEGQKTADRERALRTLLDGRH